MSEDHVGQILLYIFCHAFVGKIYLNFVPQNSRTYRFGKRARSDIHACTHTLTHTHTHTHTHTLTPNITCVYLCIGTHTHDITLNVSKITATSTQR